ncbi:MAG: hypothetical protein J7L80_01655, partial [Thermoplasmata archaeon]|nr:hypothetical protein [Thermoplasmata archaeon]
MLKKFLINWRRLFKDEYIKSRGCIKRTLWCFLSASKGRTAHTSRNNREYPLISCSDPKINYIISDFLSSFEKRIINTTLSINIRNYLQWADIFSKINKLLTDEEIKNFFMSELY